MAYNTIRPISDQQVSVFNPVAGTPTGSTIILTSPKSGRLLEAGFVPQSIITSNTTLAVAIDTMGSTLASNFVECITSTLGSFQSVNLVAGHVASVVPASPTYVNAGDAIKFVTSGGNTSAVGAQVYAIIR
jgi:ribosomal protein S5